MNSEKKMIAIIMIIKVVSKVIKMVRGPKIGSNPIQDRQLYI